MDGWDGACGVNVTRGVEWLKKAADARDGQALFQLATMHMHGGVGSGAVTRNFSKASEYLDQVCVAIALACFSCDSIMPVLARVGAPTFTADV